MTADRSFLRSNAIGFSFLLSGCAALIYQVCWQRVLFVSFGVDVESITIVVSAFMLGLGLGAIAGGLIADAMPRRVPMIFGLFEAGIAAYGACSVDLMLAVGQMGHALPHVGLALVSFGLLLPPTLLMGATLPLLIADFSSRSRNVGVSTGTLYFLNTLGASVGALLVGFFLLHWLDIRQSVYVAVTLNVIASATVFVARRVR